MQCLNVHTQNNQTGSLKGWWHYHKSENFSVEKAFVSIIFTRCCFQYVWKQKHIQILQNENLSFHSRRELRKMDIKEITTTTTTNLKTGSTAGKKQQKKGVYTVWTWQGRKRFRSALSMFYLFSGFELMNKLALGRMFCHSKDGTEPITEKRNTRLIHHTWPSQYPTHCPTSSTSCFTV